MLFPCVKAGRPIAVAKYGQDDCFCEVGLSAARDRTARADVSGIQGPTNQGLEVRHDQRLQGKPPEAEIGGLFLADLLAVAGA